MCRGSRDPKIVPGTQNTVLWPTKRLENAKTMSFDVAPKPCTSGHGPRKMSPEPKTVYYNPRKRPENAKTMSFHVAPETEYRGSRAPKIVNGTQNSVL